MHKIINNYTQACWWIGALLCANLTACSSDSTIQEEDVYDNHTPMAFGSSLSSSEPAFTRGVTSLEADFKVGTWKNFNQTGEQQVMDGYKVDYTADATPYRWNYNGVNGQVLRYWDLSAYPYEFRAVSPYFKGATILNTGINLDLSDRPFLSQTYLNEVYNITNQQGEPCVIAQVCRRKNGAVYEDRDEIKNVEINTNEKANAVREVHMPFHHLITKVGFRIFIDDPQPSSPNYRVTLKSINISVVNTENQFIIASKSYAATNKQGLSHGIYSDNTKAIGEYTLLQHGEYTGRNLRENLNRETALDLCPDYMQQIPQKDIQIRVQAVMQTDHVINGTVDDSNTITYDRILSLDKTSTTGDKFTWESDTRYVYYLHIPNLYKHDIFLYSCEILPWDEVKSSDISIEL